MHRNLLGTATNAHRCVRYQEFAMPHQQVHAAASATSSRFLLSACRPLRDCTYGTLTRRSPTCVRRLDSVGLRGLSMSLAPCNTHNVRRLWQRSHVVKEARCVGTERERIGSTESQKAVRAGRSSSEERPQNLQSLSPVNSGQVKARVSLRLHPMARRWRSKQEFATQSLRSGAWLAPMRISCRNRPHLRSI